MPFRPPVNRSLSFSASFSQRPHELDRGLRACGPSLGGGQNGVAGTIDAPPALVHERASVMTIKHGSHARGVLQKESGGNTEGSLHPLTVYHIPLILVPVRVAGD